MTRLTENTLVELCLAASEKYAGRIAFSLIRGGKIDGGRRYTYKMMGLRCRQMAALLRQLGVASGGRVMILSENCPEWPLAFFGVALAGAVSVPMLAGFSAEQTRQIAAHAEISAVCLSRPMESKIKDLPGEVLPTLPPDLPLIFIDSIDNNAGEITVSAGGVEKRVSLPDISVDEPYPRREPGDLASIIYTSGTLGNSKGVMLSHSNLISCAKMSLSMVKIHPRDRLLSVLPLAHSYECTLGLLGPVMSGAGITYLDRPPSSSVLLPAAKAVRPTAMITVPLFIEKMYRGVIAPKLRESRLYRFGLTRPLAVLAAGRKLAAALGGKLRFFGIGGAPLSAEVEHFLRKARFPYAPGYGLTEAAPLVTGAAPLRLPFRSSGAAPRGIELRIAPTAAEAAVKVTAADASVSGIGEIQVRGPNIMMGYYRDEEKTREAMPDGWLRTGDIGRVDGKGKLFVMGRLKALILGPCGENIYPEEIEGLLSTSRLVEEALVYTGEKGELVARIRLNEAAKAAVSAIEHAAEELRSWANKKLAAFSRISRIEIQQEPFEKTPTQKIKRYLYQYQQA